MTIKIIAGAAIYNDGNKSRAITPEDGEVTLPDWAEKRFVSQGVAKYVTDEIAAPVVIEEPQETIEEPPKEPEDEPSGYEAMSMAELKAECNARDIKYSARVTKAQLIESLEYDDEPPALDALGAE